jgi:hypothetical protein
MFIKKSVGPPVIKFQVPKIQTAEPRIYTFLGIDEEWCKLQEMQKL